MQKAMPGVGIRRAPQPWQVMTWAMPLAPTRKPPRNGHNTRKDVNINAGATVMRVMRLVIWYSARTVPHDATASSTRRATHTRGESFLPGVILSGMIGNVVG